MDEPIWIRQDVVLAIHQRQIAEHGGDSGLRDAGLLDSALAHPQNRLAYQEHSPTIPELAAGYASAINRNHPFVDGNKRTAFVTCMLFLKMNGYRIEASQEKKYRVFLNLAANQLTEDDLAKWLTDHSVPLG